MELTSPLLLVISSFLAVYVINFTDAGPLDPCVFQCMRGVLKCKREQSVVGLSQKVDCCQKYKMCYLVCRPDAESVPPCGGAKGKRGSWNKRTQAANTCNNNGHQHVPDFDDVVDLGQRFY
ncbi:uncharacterized protein LOC106013068 [Aplysia californica]|uniref:Uncharacterized protein LOC106013068 n=1 Tax=Aplysia californica TaxID=6500 RepID=A0ABM1A997_APLCA|nr:uncharacterized protein LOC106013068 [Aplysia californica]